MLVRASYRQTRNLTRLSGRLPPRFSAIQGAFPQRLMSSSAAVYALPQIILQPNEQRLAQLLVECADWIDAHPEEVDKLRLKDENGEWIGKARGNERVELRIAGGWVRDKLLGRASNDIDVSTSPDPLTGLKFATLFEKYLEKLGQRDIMSRLTKIEAKPEQSKHLETATAMVENLSVDWVQQRGQEVYTAGSRIPTVAFGTPLEDAERRDLTINALFYNLRTKQIEDHTQKGLADLGLIPNQPKRIRTPLDPVQTFHDDPLRVIRAVRFAARFGREFEIDQQVIDAVNREEIRAALRDPKKISRERVGIELEKMLTGKNPLLAIELIEKLDLHSLIFLYDHEKALPTNPTGSRPAPNPPTETSLRAAEILTRLLEPEPSLHPLLKLELVPDISSPTSTNPTTSYATQVDTQTVKRLFLACCLLPLHNFEIPDKKKVLWLGEKVLRDGIKWPNTDVIFSKKAKEATQILSEAVKRFGSESSVEGKEDRTEIGLILRNLSVHDSGHTRWNLSLLWSLVVDITNLATSDPIEISAIIENYNRFIQRVLAYKLEQFAFSAPILDGTTINELLPETKNSPAMVQILQLVVKWQLGNPGKGAAECQEWLLHPEMRQQVAQIVQSAAKPVAKKAKGKP